MEEFSKILKDRIGEHDPEEVIKKINN